ncbi:hypothetical protein [Flagellimonas beolgyonensis]|uniref:hypothetical protein n=1 Tax=Flagellimonas beolgyonensis TaxID=864064 RepID=UPI000F8ECF1E|nr:hypothetical protein [Allomuricauda beolgyonensis]
MRKIKAVMVAAMLFAAVGVFANMGNEEVPVKSLSSQIYEMLKKNQFNVEADELKAEVRFIINEDAELIVLSVDTKNETLEGFVKNRLNYQKVELDKIVPGKVYEVPVRITE